MKKLLLIICLAIGLSSFAQDSTFFYGVNFGQDTAIVMIDTQFVYGMPFYSVKMQTRKPDGSYITSGVEYNVSSQDWQAVLAYFNPTSFIGNAITIEKNDIEMAIYDGMGSYSARQVVDSSGVKVQFDNGANEVSITKGGLGLLVVDSVNLPAGVYGNTLICSDCTARDGSVGVQMTFINQWKKLW